MNKTTGTLGNYHIERNKQRGMADRDKNLLKLRGNDLELTISNRAFSNPKIEIEKSRNSIDLTYHENLAFENNFYNKSIFAP